MILNFTLLPSLALSFVGGLNNAIRQSGTGNITLNSVVNNVITFLLGLTTVIALAVLIFAGIMYILSLGDEARTAKAKRTILYAILGLLIVGLAETIRDTVLAIRDQGSVGSFTTRFIGVILGIMQVLIAPAAVLAFGALVVGGYMYITSAGDESRSARAKRVILYALLGLLVIGIAGVIVNVVVNVLP